MSRRRRKARRERRRVRRANRWLKRYRGVKTKTLVNAMLPLQPEMTRAQIDEFIKNLQSIAIINAR